MDTQYDLFVIGGGSGGVRAARIAATHGARVAIAEEYRYGGTCVIRGCVPKKLFVYASEFSHEFKEAAGYGWTVGESSFSWQTLLQNKDKEIDRLNGIYIRLLERSGVEVLDGRAEITGKHELTVNGQKITAQKVLVATGGTPFLPQVPGIEHAISSNEAFHLEQLPKRIAVVGGGYIAVEFAHIFAGLGCETHLIYRRHSVLRGFDLDIRDIVSRNLSERGIHTHFNANVTQIDKAGDELTLHMSEHHHSSGHDGAHDEAKTLTVGQVMYATGRTPNTTSLGLEEQGVELGERGQVIVDEYSKSTANWIYAVGDCTDRVNLTPVAIQEGHAFADTVFGNAPRSISYKNVPSAVFSQPAAASVGLTESQACQELGHSVDIYKTEFRPLKHTISGSTEKVLIKLIVDPQNDKLLGAHMVGKEAAEIIQLVAVAINMGATKADFDRTIALHPSTAEEFVLLRTKWVEPALNT